MKFLRIVSVFVLAIIANLLFSCKDDDVPQAENEEEVIDLVRLTFTPGIGGSPIIINSTDPDGSGPQNFNTPDIVLEAETLYTLSIELENTQTATDITDEIEMEDDEHMFFFGWTGGLFALPPGDGNIGADSRDDTVNYQDQDENGHPLGLSTIWEMDGPKAGEFTIVLKHQPGIKSSTSTSEDGETDIKLTWNISIQ